MSEDLSIEAYDAREQEHRHRMEMSRQREESQTERAHLHLKTERWETAKVVGLGLVAALALIGVVLIIWRATAGPSASDQIEERLRTQCTEEHGSWVTLDSGDSTSGKGTCIWNGEKP